MRSGVELKRAHTQFHVCTVCREKKKLFIIYNMWKKGGLFKIKVFFSTRCLHGAWYWQRNVHLRALWMQFNTACAFANWFADDYIKQLKLPINNCTFFFILLMYALSLSRYIFDRQRANLAQERWCECYTYGCDAVCVCLKWKTGFPIATINCDNDFINVFGWKKTTATARDWKDKNVQIEQLNFRDRREYWKNILFNL